MKQTEAINEALLVAQQIINLHRHEFILPEHILLAFFSNGRFSFEPHSGQPIYSALKVDTA